MKELERIIKKLKEMAEDAEFMKRHKLSEKAFTRDRKLKVRDIVYFVMSLVKTTLPFELDRYFSESGGEPVVPSSMTKARSKLSYKAFEEMLAAVVAEISGAKRLKGYRVLAVDGLRGEMQNTPELREKFPPIGESRYPQFHAVAMYDVMNRIFTKAMFLPAPANESSSAVSLVQSLERNEKELLLFDRGFPSVALIQALNDADKGFVMRVSSSFLREVNDFTKSQAEDETLHICYSNRRGQTSEVKNAVLPYDFNLRCVKIQLPSEETEVLVTNLSDAEFSTEELGMLYGMRWGIETSYNYLKNSIYIEDFVSVLENSIRQEFYAALIVFNMASILVGAAQTMYDHKKNDKTPVQNKLSKKHGNLTVYDD